MSIYWYQKHMEPIVKENQLLKFSNKKKNFDIRIILDSITRIFLDLFPDIPPLRASANNPSFLEQQLAYYQKSASAWIRMIRMKVQLYEANVRQAESQFTLEERRNLKKWLDKTSTEKTELCLLCQNPKNKQIFEKISLKIVMLQKQMEELHSEIKHLQEQQQKYLKQISYLRSITKKLQYELALKITKEKKINRLQEQQDQSKNEKLEKQIEIWRAEYDRLWKQLQKSKKNETRAQLDKFQQQHKLQYSSCREQIYYGDLASTHNSNIWIVRYEDSEYSQQDSQQGAQRKGQSPSIKL